MRMSRKHFELLASSLRAARQRVRSADSRELQGIDAAAETIADDLACTNPAFDRDRFLNACHHGQLALAFDETSALRANVLAVK